MIHVAQILRTIPSFYPHVTGPANQAWHVARRLGVNSFANTIITTDEHAADAPRQEQRDGLRIERLRRSRVGALAYRGVYGARRRLTTAPASIIHAHSYRNALTTLAHRAAKQRGLPYVFQPHGQLLMYQYLLGPLGRCPYRGYDALTRKREVLDADAVVVATSQEYREALAFGVPADRMHIIPMGVNERTEPPVPRGGNPTLRLLFVGRIEPGRNPLQLVRAVAQLPWSMQRQVELRFVGPIAARSQLHREKGHLQTLRHEMHRSGVAARCRLLGALYGEQLEAQYAEADVFVFPSRYENFGQTILEAGNAGLPVLATATGVADDLICDGETGHVIRYDDTAELTRCLMRLVEDREAVARMGRAMFDRVQAHYRWDHVIERYRSLYTQLLQ